VERGNHQWQSSGQVCVRADWDVGLEATQHARSNKTE